MFFLVHITLTLKGPETLDLAYIGFIDLLPNRNIKLSSSEFDKILTQELIATDTVPILGS